MKEDKLPMWKPIKMGDKLPCQSFLRKRDGEILKLSTIGGVTVGQDCYYIPVDEVINVIKDYPVEVNEDEEIRKELLLDIPKVFPHDKAFRYIAYLEKQGEDKVEPKFHEGDWVVSPNGVYWHIDAINNNRYEVSSTDGARADWPLNTGLYRLWTIQDAKDGDVVADKSDGAIGIFQSIGHHPDGGSYNDPSYCFLHCRYDDGFFYADFENGNEIDSDYLVPATKEQRDLLFQKMHEACYEWNAEKKELKKIGQQPTEWHREDEQNLNACLGYIPDEFLRRWLIDAIHVKYDRHSWSEEDEVKLQNTIDYIEELIHLTKINPDIDDDNIKYYQDSITFLKSLKDRVQLQPKQAWSEEEEDIKDSIIHQLKMLRGDRNVTEGNKKEIEWLKSLRPQSTWKPSDEQLYNLSEAAHYRNGFWDCDILIGLYDEIKKLREG